MSVLLPTRSAAVASALTFDSALLVVADCIAEAHSCVESGRPHQAKRLYHVAERFAIQTGFTELMRLVWTYQDGDGL
jgi:hypothetical protein